MSGDEYTYYDLAISMVVVGSHTAVTDVSSVVPLTNPSDKTLKLWVQAEDQAVRFTIDGTNPTISPALGFTLGSSEWIVLTVPVDGVVKFLEKAASASLQYVWME